MGAGPSKRATVSEVNGSVTVRPRVCHSDDHTVDGRGLDPDVGWNLGAPYSASRCITVWYLVLRSSHHKDILASDLTEQLEHQNAMLAEGLWVCSLVFLS